MGSRSIMRRFQTGFTIMEMMVVVVVLGILVGFTTKSVRGAWVGSKRHAASREVTAYLHRTRGIGIQQSRSAWLLRSGNVVKILVESSGTPVQLGSAIDLSQRYAVTLSATPKDTIQFDPRGLVVNLTQTPKLIVTIGTAADTVCVTGLGRI